MAALALVSAGVVWRSETKNQTRLASSAIYLARTAAEPQREGQSAGKPVSSNPGPLTFVQTAQDIPQWACPFGKEFWHHNGNPSKSRNPTNGWAPGGRPFELSETVDRVSHAFRSTRGGTAAEVNAGGYHATLDSQSLTFVPSEANGNGNAGTDNGGAQVEARFQTRLVQRAEQTLFSAASATVDSVVVGNTKQSLLNSGAGLVEHIEAREPGVELTWLVQQALKGQGSLVIEAEVAGLQFGPETASGLHLIDTTGTSRVKIGQVTARDFAGRSWPVPMEVAGNTLRVTVSGDVLDQASFPLAIDPVISAEFGVDQPIQGPSPCTRAAPAIAAGPSGYLVVWTHGKSDLTDLGVYAARVDQAGTLLDPYGFLISASAGEQTVSAAAANGDSFLVAWSAPHGSSTVDWDILGARISTNGVVLDATPLPICAMVTTIQNSPAVTANGQNYLVVWRDSRFTGIFGNLVAPDGTVSVTNGFPICTALNDQYTPAVASLGTNFLVVWQDYRKATSTRYDSDIYGARVSGTGVLIDTNNLAVCTQTNSQFHPAVAANGTNYLVVWEDSDLGGGDILGARVSADGLILDAPGLTIAHGANLQANPAVTATGGDFLVVWQDYRGSSTNNFEAQIYGARVQGDGSVVDPVGVNLSPGTGGQAYPALASGGAQAFVVWQDFRNNPGTTFADVYGAQVEVGATLAVHGEAKISGAANSEVSPAVAANGTNFLVVWADNRNALLTGRDIYGARLNSEGVPLDLTPLAISSATNDQSDPAVAANGADYFVAWSDKRNAADNSGPSDIYGTIVGPDGIVQQPGGIPICTATNEQLFPALSAFGTNFLVVWQDARNTVPTAVRWDIYGARISRAGDPLDPFGIPICTFLPDQTTPAVAANPAQALVIWVDSRGAAGASHIYATRLAPDGTVTDTNGFVICTAAGQQLAPAVATDGTNYLAVWADSRNGSASAFDIYGARIGAGASVTPVNGLPIALGPAPQTAPAVTFNGSDYLVVWQQGRGGSSNSFDIFGTTLGLDASAGAGSPFVINANPANQLAPATAAETDGRFLVLNQVFASASARTVGNLLEVIRLEPGATLSNGQFQFRLDGATGRRYGIQASDDLKTWSQVGDVLSTNTSMWFTDPDSTNLARRFYRAVLLP